MEIRSMFRLLRMAALAAWDGAETRSIDRLREVFLCMSQGRSRTRSGPRRWAVGRSRSVRANQMNNTLEIGAPACFRGDAYSAPS